MGVRESEMEGIRGGREREKGEEEYWHLK